MNLVNAIWLSDLPIRTELRAHRLFHQYVYCALTNNSAVLDSTRTFELVRHAFAEVIAELKYACAYPLQLQNEFSEATRQSIVESLGELLQQLATHLEFMRDQGSTQNLDICVDQLFYVCFFHCVVQLLMQEQVGQALTIIFQDNGLKTFFLQRYQDKLSLLYELIDHDDLCKQIQALEGSDDMYKVMRELKQQHLPHGNG